MDAAEKKTREFFEKQESEVKGLMPPSPVNAEQAILPRPIDQADSSFLRLKPRSY